MTRAGSNGSDPSDDHLQINLPPPTFEFGLSLTAKLCVLGPALWSGRGPQGFRIAALGARWVLFAFYSMPKRTATRDAGRKRRVRLPVPS